MKVIQITAVANGDFTNIYGLTDDGKVCFYHYKTGSWKLWKPSDDSKSKG